MEREGRNGGKLKDFKPGQSGNPAGRPKGTPNVATRMRRFLELEMTAKNPITKTEESFTVAELMDLQIISKAVKGDIMAWEKINDRLEGKASQKSDITADITVNGQSELTPDQAEKILSIVRGKNK